MFTLIEIAIMIAVIVGTYVAAHFIKNTPVRVVLIVLLFLYIGYMFFTREANHIFIAAVNHLA